MKARIKPTPAQKKRIDRAIKEHNALKQANEVLKGYKCKSFKILKVKKLITDKLKKK